MPVNTPHPAYQDRVAEWEQVEDCVEGAKAVKARGQTYLHALSNQKPEDYSSYKRRAVFFQATARTADAWLGMLARRAPAVTAPSLDAILADIDLQGNPVGNYSETVLWHLIKTARAGTLIDWSLTDNRPYVAHYAAVDIINWTVQRIGGVPTLTSLILHEISEEYVPATGTTAPDPYERPSYHQWREFTLNIAPAPEGTPADTPAVRSVTWKLWRQKQESKPITTTTKKATKGSKAEGDEFIQIATGELTRRNIPLPAIPFVFHGTGDDRATPDKPPLLDLSEINLSHYCLSADYEHGLHIAGLPTPWAAGFTSDGDTKLSLGMTTAWVSDDVQAKCGFLEFTGTGLTAIKDALKDKEAQMASLGAKPLEARTQDAEALETVKLRASAESNSLTSIAEAASRSLGEVVRWLAWWAGTAASIKDLEQSHTVAINKDLISHKISPQMLTGLTAALQAGAISYETYFYQLVEGEIIPEGRTVEEERTGIDNNPLPPAAKDPEPEPTP
jgi:hypothetical protein